jgi:hypothetical protein
MKRLKICIVASAGGYLSQLLKLVDSWNGYETFSITTTEIVREKHQIPDEVVRYIRQEQMG